MVWEILGAKLIVFGGKCGVSNRKRKDQRWLMCRVNSSTLIEAMNKTGRFLGSNQGD